MKSKKEKIIEVVLIGFIAIGFAVFAWLIESGKIDIKADTNTACIQEGGSGAVVPGEKNCCAGLSKISPDVYSPSIHGSDGSSTQETCIHNVGAFYCSNCGNGVCDSHENKCNCPADCGSLSPIPSPTSACVTLGGAGPNGSLGPNDPNKDKVCCSGLKTITPKTGAIETTPLPNTDPNDICKYADGAGTICAACGDGICDSKYENKCNCPSDCKNQAAPVSPQDLKLESVNDNTIKLSWSSLPSVEAEKFNIYQIHSPTTLIASVNNPGPGQTLNYTVKNLVCSSNYSFYITSIINGKESGPSSTVSIKTTNCIKITQLIATGSNLIFNIVLAVLLTLALGYFIFRKDIWQKK